MDVPEAARLRALEDYGVLDTGPEETFDRLTSLAADLFDTPVSLVTLIDAERQWFKSRFGVDEVSTSRDIAFCTHALDLAPGEVLVIEDAQLDPRFSANPMVTGVAQVRFYAGAVLTGRDGHNLGTLCVLDTKPRPRPSERDLARLAALACMVVDVMELRRASRRLLETQSQLALAERMSGVGQWSMHVASGRVTWSDEVYRIHGVDRGFTLDYDSIFAFYPLTDRDMVTDLTLGAIRSRSGFEYETSLTAADGQHRVVICKADVILDENGYVETLCGVYQDVTDQRLAVNALQRGKARYKLLADNVADVITRMRMDGQSTYISPAIFKLLGYQPAEMAGRPAQAFVHLLDVPLLMAAFADMTAGVSEKTVQLRAAHKDGHPVWVETHFKLIRDDQGEPVEVVAVIRDITRHKALEGQLRQAQREAEAAATAKGEFLANMSHELRTPLTSIIGFTRLVSDLPDLSPMARDYVDRVGQASRALLTSVNDILDFSKLEAGQVSFDLQPTSLARLGRSTLDLLAPQADAKALSLTLDAGRGDDEIALLIDPDRLRQILLNLVGNAVKFTASGGVVLRSRYNRAAETLQIEVIDTGPGIAIGDQDRLFQRFSQVDGSHTRAHGGTGLGLAICKGLVEAMGGEIGVESQPGGGSRFWFRIPATLAPALFNPTAIPPAQLSAPPGLRVLIADDHPANRELVRLFLAGVGAEVTDAVDGEEAASLAGERTYDVILMDLRMPRLDGHDALRLIRAAGGPNIDTPILAFSADVGVDVGLMGFAGFVAKPIEPAALIGAVIRAVSGAPPTAGGLAGAA